MIKKQFCSEIGLVMVIFLKSVNWRKPAQQLKGQSVSIRNRQEVDAGSEFCHLS